MPNVLDAEPARRAARRAARKIQDEKIATRFEKLAFDRLLADPRNFRLASQDEVDAAPAWARAAAQRGEHLNVCALSRGAILALHGVARQLAQVCALAAMAQAPTPEDGRLIEAAREFLHKIDRVGFDLMARKARMFAGQHQRLAAAESPLCAPGQVGATQDRIWRRITTLSELRALGRELTNCLARTSETSAYGGRLKDGQAQFWVLRDGRGVALMAAMAPTGDAFDFIEVKGPRNTPVSRTNPDLKCLAKAILMHGDVPPASSLLADSGWMAPAGDARPQISSVGLPGRGIPSISAPLFALDSQEEIARLRFGVSEVVITRRRRRAS
jgi:pimeloyl-ACP methyl ester carboxylesterase